ncbi:MAG: GH3 auxin-responsive promoter family protein [Asgard group archaeon]|nr:GH3 auxin-responsive promoter family protein [Asgard group archaeon]
MLSKIVKKVAQVTMHKYRKKLEDPMASQREALMEIINANKETIFGMAHNFSSITNIRSYQRNVPLHNYDDLHQYIEFSFKYDGVLSKDPVIHWIQSTGTLGKPKIIPMTESSLKKWSKGGTRLTFAYILDKPGNEKFLNGKILGYAGQSELRRIRGIPVGYISGAVCTRVSNPLLLKRLIPKANTLNIEDWRERLWQFMMDTVGEDIRAMTGIPPVIIGFLQAIQTNLPFQVAGIKDSKVQRKVQNAIFEDTIDFEMLWPNLQFFGSSGVVAEPYKPMLRELLSDSITMPEMYSCSEGQFAFQMHEDEEGMYLNIDNYFFEFKKVGKPNEIKLLSDVKKNVPYELLISSIAGLYRYNMHDIIEFVSTDPPKIVIKGRVGNVLNIGSEKVSEDQLIIVLSEAMKQLQKHPVDYVVSGTHAFPLRHKVFIELSNFSKKDEKKAKLLSKIYDDLMKKMNTSYHISREQQALTIPEIHILKKGAFRKISERKAEENNQLEHLKILHIIPPERLDSILDDDWISYSFTP